MMQISDDQRLGSGCANTNDPFFVHHVTLCGIFANEKLAFVPAVAAINNQTILGQKKLLSVHRQIDRQWRLLTPHSLYKDPKSLISWGCSESWVEMYFQTMT
jgi:hypothetical protein